MKGIMCSPPVNMGKQVPTGQNGPANQEEDHYTIHLLNLISYSFLASTDKELETLFRMQFCQPSPFTFNDVPWQ